MRRALRIVFLVICGIVGAWAGYWLGHLAGWSEDADWPGRIGGGSGAILLAIATSVVAVLLARWTISRPREGERRGRHPAP
jgi:uncharacterized membrane protein YeaQ/YmgE (transglycosylase-associated protein family)